MRLRALPVAICALLSPLAAGAADDPERRCNMSRIFTPTMFDVPAHVLVMKKPEFLPEKLAEGAAAPKPRMVLASQSIRIEPDRAWLSRTIDFTDEKGRSLGKAVPLSAGSPITRWSSAPDAAGKSQIWHCSVGWRDGLFGGATGDGHYRWICFEDRDGDGLFETGFRPQSKNLGLTFRQLDMPIDPPVAFLEAPPEGTSGPEGKNVQALEGGFTARAIVVDRVKDGLVQLAYMGPGGPAGRDLRRAELALDRPGSATIAGITVDLAIEKGKPMLRVSGAFDAIEPVPACNGATWRLGDWVPMVNWAFPNW